MVSYLIFNVKDLVMGGSRWSAEEIEDLKGYVGRNLSYKEISDITGRSANSISIKVHNLKTIITISENVRRKNTVWDEKMDSIISAIHDGNVHINDAMTTLNLPYTVVRSRLDHIKKYGNRYIIQEMYDRDVERCEISRITGVSIENVNKMIFSFENDTTSKELYKIFIDQGEYVVKFPKRKFKVVPENDHETAVLAGTYRCKCLADLNSFCTSFVRTVEKLQSVDLDSYLKAMLVKG